MKKTIRKKRPPASYEQGAWPEKTKTLLASCLLVISFLSTFSSSATAQRSSGGSRSYITPFPSGDRYKLYVLGDSLADGTWAGLTRAFPRSSTMDVIRQSKVGTGLARVSRFNWNIVIDKLLNVNKIHIAVVMMGANDDKNIRVNRKTLKFLTAEWKKAYGKRIDLFMKRLKRSNVAVYWVGMPIMAKPNFNAGMQAINDLIREKAFINGIKFVDTWNGFTDQFGRYSVYGPDLAGRVRRLRAKDGVHFTPTGYRKLAHFVEQEIRKDLKAAKQERDIPLAGAVEEQSRATGRKDIAALVPAQQPEKKAPAALKRKTKASKSRNRKKVEKKKAKSPPKARTNIKNPLHGETLANEMSIGLTALASVSSLNDTSTKEGHRRLPLAERPYHKVLVKGLTLRPKLGRSDNFSWPKSGG